LRASHLTNVVHDSGCNGYCFIVAVGNTAGIVLFQNNNLRRQIRTVRAMQKPSCLAKFVETRRRAIIMVLHPAKAVRYVQHFYKLVVASPLLIKYENKKFLTRMLSLCFVSLKPKCFFLFFCCFFPCFWGIFADKRNRTIIKSPCFLTLLTFQ